MLVRKIWSRVCFYGVPHGLLRRSNRNGDYPIIDSATDGKEEILEPVDLYRNNSPNYSSSSISEEGGGGGTSSNSSTKRNYLPVQKTEPMDML